MGPQITNPQIAKKYGPKIANPQIAPFVAIPQIYIKKIKSCPYSPFAELNAGRSPLIIEDQALSPSQDLGSYHTKETVLRGGFKTHTSTY